MADVRPRIGKGSTIRGRVVLVTRTRGTDSGPASDINNNAVLMTQNLQVLTTQGGNAFIPEGQLTGGGGAPQQLTRADSTARTADITSITADSSQ